MKERERSRGQWEIELTGEIVISGHPESGGGSVHGGTDQHGSVIFSSAD